MQKIYLPGVMKTVKKKCECENKAKVIRRPCDSTSGNLNKTSVREKSRGVYLAIG